MRCPVPDINTEPWPVFNFISVYAARAMELFLEKLARSTVEIAQARQAKTLSTSHMYVSFVRERCAACRAWQLPSRVALQPAFLLEIAHNQAWQTHMSLCGTWPCTQQTLRHV